MRRRRAIKTNLAPHLTRASIAFSRGDNAITQVESGIAATKRALVCNPPGGVTRNSGNEYVQCVCVKDGIRYRITTGAVNTPIYRQAEGGTKITGTQVFETIIGRGMWSTSKGSLVFVGAGDLGSADQHYLWRSADLGNTAVRAITRLSGTPFLGLPNLRATPFAGTLLAGAGATRDIEIASADDIYGGYYYDITWTSGTAKRRRKVYLAVAPHLAAEHTHPAILTGHFDDTSGYGDALPAIETAVGLQRWSFSADRWCFMETPNGDLYFATYNTTSDIPNDIPKYILKSVDDGRSWDVILAYPNGAMTPTNIGHFHGMGYHAATGRLIASGGDILGTRGIIYSDDGGTTWSTYSVNAFRPPVAWIDYGNATYMIAGGDDTNVLGRFNVTTGIFEPFNLPFDKRAAAYRAYCFCPWVHEGVLYAPSVGRDDGGGANVAVGTVAGGATLVASANVFRADHVGGTLKFTTSGNTYTVTAYTSMTTVTVTPVIAAADEYVVSPARAFMTRPLYGACIAASTDWQTTVNPHFGVIWRMAPAHGIGHYAGYWNGKFLLQVSSSATEGDVWLGLNSEIAIPGDVRTEPVMMVSRGRTQYLTAAKSMYVDFVASTEFLVAKGTITKVAQTDAAQPPTKGAGQMLRLASTEKGTLSDSPRIVPTNVGAPSITVPVMMRSYILGKQQTCSSDTSRTYYEWPSASPAGVALWRHSVICEPAVPVGAQYSPFVLLYPENVGDVLYIDGLDGQVLSECIPEIYHPGGNTKALDVVSYTIQTGPAWSHKFKIWPGHHSYWCFYADPFTVVPVWTVDYDQYVRTWAVDATHYISVWWDAALKKWVLTCVDGGSTTHAYSAAQFFVEQQQIEFNLKVSTAGVVLRVKNGQATETITNATIPTGILNCASLTCNTGQVTTGAAVLTMGIGLDEWTGAGSYVGETRQSGKSIQRFSK